jgi:hypothetical protein
MTIARSNNVLAMIYPIDFPKVRSEEDWIAIMVNKKKPILPMNLLSMMMPVEI